MSKLPESITINNEVAVYVDKFASNLEKFSKALKNSNIKSKRIERYLICNIILLGKLLLKSMIFKYE